MNEHSDRSLSYLRLIDEITRGVATGVGDQGAASRCFDQAARRIQTAFGLCTLAVYAGQPLSLRMLYGGKPSELGAPVPEGLAMLALCGQKTPYVPDLSLRQRPSLPPWVAETARSELAIPFCNRGRRIGILDLYSPEVNAFDVLDIQTLTILARQLTLLISRSRASDDDAQPYARLRSRLQEATTLQNITRSVDYAAGLADVLKHVVEAIRVALQADGASVVLADGLNNGTNHDGVVGTTPPTQLRTPLQAKVMQTGKPVIIPDIDRRFPDAGIEGHVRAILMVPLTSAKGKVIGALGAYAARSGAFSQEHEHLLTVAAGQIAVVVENVILYQNLERRSRRLEHAYQRLQEFSELKDQILQNISHELRTPLTLIKGYIELIVDGQLGPIHPDQEQSLLTIDRKADDIVRIIEQMVSLSPLDSLSLDYARFPVRDLMEELLSIFRRHTADKPVSISLMPVPPDLYVEADFEQIRRACYNILDNAIKFSPNGGHVMMGATQEGEYVHLSFHDQGIGIPKGRLSQIFETFYQIDGTSTRRFGGLGLGLAVVNRVVNAHMGKVWAESELDQGSTFHILLPQKRPPSRVLATNPGLSVDQKV